MVGLVNERMRLRTLFLLHFISVQIGDLLFVLAVGLWTCAILDLFAVGVQYLLAYDGGLKSPCFGSYAR